MMMLSNKIGNVGGGSGLVQKNEINICVWSDACGRRIEYMQ